MSPRAKKRLVLGLAAVILLITGWGVLRSRGTAQERAAAARVHALLGSIGTQQIFGRSEQEVINELVGMGPAAYPELSRLLRLRNVSGNRPYARVFYKIPALIRKHLPDPDEPGTWQGRAAVAVYLMGPIASRAMLGAVCDNLEHRSNDVISQQLLLILYWSVPDSPRAVKTLEDWLKQPPHGFLFGEMDALQIYATVPSVAPLLPRWLRSLDPAREGCMALGKVGTNAAFALRDLLEVAEQGVAGKPPSNSLRLVYQTGFNPAIQNRIAALDALGEIGVTDGRVLAVLTNAVTSTNNDVRAHAVVALEKLKQPIGPFLADVLRKYPVHCSHRTTEWFETLSRLGSQDDLPGQWLEQWCDPAKAESLPPLPVGSEDLPVPLERFANAAFFATCRASLAFRQKNWERLANSATNWSASEILADWTPLPPNVRDRLVATLRSSIPNEHTYAAYVLLKHDRDDETALRVLRSELDAPGGPNRFESRPIQAAAFLWRATHRCDDKMLDLLAREAESNQTACSILLQMGTNALPAVPALKRVLESRNPNDPYIRAAAGHALRQIAPEQMPPIHEN